MMEFSQSDGILDLFSNNPCIYYRRLWEFFELMKVLQTLLLKWLTKLFQITFQQTRGHVMLLSRKTSMIIKALSFR